MNDAPPMVAWLTVMQEALINLGQHNFDLCLAHMEAFFREGKRCWSSDRSEVRNNIQLSFSHLWN